MRRKGPAVPISKRLDSSRINAMEQLRRFGLDFKAILSVSNEHTISHTTVTSAALTWPEPT